MQIVLTQDLSKQKGWVRGRALNWERPTITAVSKQMGHQDWFDIAEELETKTRVKAMAKTNKREVAA